jgi:hypothetical protein
MDQVPQIDSGTDVKHGAGDQREVKNCFHGQTLCLPGSCWVDSDKFVQIYIGGDATTSFVQMQSEVPV